MQRTASEEKQKKGRFRLSGSGDALATEAADSEPSSADASGPGNASIRDAGDARDAPAGDASAGDASTRGVPGADAPAGDAAIAEPQPAIDQTDLLEQFKRQASLAYAEQVQRRRAESQRVAALNRAASEGGDGMREGGRASPSCEWFLAVPDLSVSIPGARKCKRARETFIEYSIVLLSGCQRATLGRRYGQFLRLREALLPSHRALVEPLGFPKKTLFSDSPSAFYLYLGACRRRTPRDPI